MTRRSAPVFALAGSLLVFAALPIGAADPSELVDLLGTLDLDQELPTRGNLGGVTVDKLGYLYVANFRDAVWRIDPDGQVETLTTSLYGASGNAVDSRGDLFQGNFHGNTITRVTRNGEVTLFAGEGLNGPVGIAIDGNDTLFVCNCSGNTLSRVAPSGRVSSFAESELFACPNGITFDDRGHLFVTNFNNHDIVEVTPAGEASRFVTVPGGAGNAHITFSKGFFYVTKIMAHQVYRISPTREVTLVAGTGQPGHDDGPALDGTLHRPNGIAVSPSGDRLYLNTLLGEFNQAARSRVTVRTIDLMTLTKLLEESLEAGGVEAMSDAYRRYRADPVRGRENTVAEMVAYGYRLLQTRKIPEALSVFELNAEANPEAAAAQFQLGEAYRYTGQTEKAIAQFERALEIDPGHAQASARIAQLAEGGSG